MQQENNKHANSYSNSNSNSISNVFDCKLFKKLIKLSTNNANMDTINKKTIIDNGNDDNDNDGKDDDDDNSE